ncbi:MAG: hypothetical protein ABIG43_00265, partial [Chloroflexota bacterium]
GLDYLDKTGRIGGWEAYFLRGSVTVKAPKEICNVINQYSTSEGALSAIRDFPPESVREYKLVDDNYPLGDFAHLYIYKEMQSSGEYLVFHRIDVVYRNFVTVVHGFGLEKEFDVDFVTNLAEIVIDKLKEAPLGNW